MVWGERSFARPGRVEGDRDPPAGRWTISGPWAEEGTALFINHRLVLPEHLNHYGYLFGGCLLRWVDEYAYIAANLDFPGHRFVTIGLDNVVFRRSIRMGSVLRFEIEREALGTTSVTYRVRVFCGSIVSGERVMVFENRITYVNIDEEGRKEPIRPGPGGEGEVLET